MNMEHVQQRIGDYGKDIRLNLKSVLSTEGAPGLNDTQIWGIALSSAYATRSSDLVAAVHETAATRLTPEAAEAAKSAATIMAMTNVYYRFMHLCEDKRLSGMPARLRMNGLANPGVARVDFELYTLAVSALSGCGMCINAHVHELQKAGVSQEGIQSAVRIAAVLNAAAQALSMGEGSMSPTA